MAVGDRIGKAEDRVGPAPCAYPAPCRIGATTELVLRPDGTKAQVGNPPPPLCATCPERENPQPRIRHIEVVRDLRNRYAHLAQHAASAATRPTVGYEVAEREDATPQTTDGPTAPEPDDGLPAAWGPDHPARLAAQGREPPARRSSNRSGASGIRPEDFGVT